ncbi:MAG: hypothetical protein M0R80_01830 [Proteobacteria bacterium]|jgi:hypothetical protein|nr:hypothetical protein [Pseudomonadota bacterium]
MWFDKQSGCARMTVQEAFDLGLIPYSKCVYGPASPQKGARDAMLTCSAEFLHDSSLIKKTLYAVRGGPISPEDAREWKKWWEILKNLDFDAVVRKYNVKFEKTEHDLMWEPKPYYDPPGWSEENGWS